MGCFSMPKGAEGKRYPPEFRKMAAEAMPQEPPVLRPKG